MDEIWYLIESVSVRFPTYSSYRALGRHISVTGRHSIIDDLMLGAD